MSKPYKSNPVILNEVRDYFDGLMLSDGHIERKSMLTGRYCHLCKEKNWLDKISEDLYGYGIECTVNNGRLYIGGFSIDEGSLAYSLRTYDYVEFKEMHDRWYKKDYNIDEYPTTRWHLDKRSGEYYAWKKIVPKDICLTPGCVANWYLGDGNIHKDKRKYTTYTLSLATNDFIENDVLFLLELLFELLDIKCGIANSGVINICNRADISTFLNYIKDYKVNCYLYKFPEGAMCWRWL